MRVGMLTSPVYYIISGIQENEGGIVAREYSKEVLVETLNSSQWFMVQTNHDRDQEDPLDDYRRIPAENKIKEVGKVINFQGLFTILNQSPNKNNDTIYTSIQSANDNYMNTTIYTDEI